MSTELAAAARAIAEASGFEFVGPVGEGAFKETFQVMEGDVPHALKVFRPHARSERVNREIDAMLRCNHPNIAKLRKVDVLPVAGLGDCMYVLEEFLSGGTLASRLQHQLLSPAETVALGELLVDAVGHIAERELVHRDIKLENIMLREDRETPVLVDFGLVRSLRELSLTQSWAPQGPGTPFFAPAEQLCNDKELIDWRADQFSLGVSLAIGALGLHPYQQSGSDRPFEIVERVAGRKERPAEPFVTAATKAGLPALIRMVAPWPVQRFRTPDALSAAWHDQREPH